MPPAYACYFLRPYSGGIYCLCIVSEDIHSFGVQKSRSSGVQEFRQNERDPGKLVVQMLMNILADETQRDIAVVLCGYKEPMMKLLDTNPGLLSRFPNKFEFSDFTVDELLEITRRRIKTYDYQFTTEAWEKYCSMLAHAYQVRDPETWGNARFITNLLDRIYIQHASRCVKKHPKNKRELLMLTPDDIVPIETPRRKAKMGF